MASVEKGVANELSFKIIETCFVMFWFVIGSVLCDVMAPARGCDGINTPIAPLAAHTDTYNMYCGRKKHLTPPETVKAIRSLGVPATNEEILSIGAQTGL